jgi:hypothetical protein
VAGLDVGDASFDACWIANVAVKMFDPCPLFLFRFPSYVSAKYEGARLGQSLCNRGADPGCSARYKCSFSF